MAAAAALAQELSPRAYWPAPEGTTVLFAGYAHSSGDVIINPSVQVQADSASMNYSQVGFLRTFGLAGRTANLILELPYVWGSAEGSADGAQMTRDLSGIGDVAMTASVNLLGAPSMTPADFRELRAQPRPIVGASLKILAPTGEYDTDKVINVGANRWALKAELGNIVPLKPKWLLELELGTWFFGDNDDFLGLTREQDPIVAAEIHLVKRIQPGRWVSIEVNYYSGGQTTVDGQEQDDQQRNSSIGGSFAWTFGRRHAVKVGVSTGLVTEWGGDFITGLATYQVLLN
jgi:hypothetical protein